MWIASWTAIVLAAVLGAILVLRRRAGHPLGWALLIAAVSLAAGGAVLGRFRHDPPSLTLVSRVAAGLCLGWMLVAILLRRHRAKLAGGHDAIAIIQFWALACGMLSIIILGYAAVVEILYRAIAYGFIVYRQPIVTWDGLVQIAAVAAAGGIGLRLTRERALGTLVFGLSVFAAVWLGLMIEPVQGRRVAGNFYAAVPTDWAAVTIACMAVVLAAAVAVQHAGGILARKRAWPDRLRVLVDESALWPGFRFSAGLTAVAILALGCLMPTRPWTIPAAGIASAAMFLLAARSWSESVAETAMALATLAVVSLAMLGTGITRPGLEDFPVMFQRLLIALGIMTWFWYWLADVWVQQLDNGTAWTTAGRMITRARRVGFMVAAIGAFIASQLAQWPMADLVTDPDRSPARWIGGMVSIGVFLLATSYTAVRYRHLLLAWFSIFAVAALVAFVHFRSQGSPAHLWVVRRLPLLLALLGPIVAALPRVLRLQSRNPYSSVLPLTGILVLPGAAFLSLHVREDSELAGRWIVSATLAVLAVWYVCLSLRQPLRPLLWIGLALANLAAIDFWSARGSSGAVVSAATAAQVTVSGWVLLAVYWGELRTVPTRIIAALTAPAAGVLAAFVVSAARRMP